MENIDESWTPGTDYFYNIGTQFTQYKLHITHSTYYIAYVVHSMIVHTTHICTQLTKYIQHTKVNSSHSPYNTHKSATLSA